MPERLDLQLLIQSGFHTIVDAIGDAISVQDLDLKVIYQNAAHIGLMGDHIGEYCYTAYQCNAAPCSECHLLQSFRDGQVHRREATSFDAQRGQLWVEIVSAPLRNAAGEIVGGVESVRDITSRYLLEKKLAKHVAAMESSMDGIAILNEAGVYEFLNQAHASIYGYDRPGDLIGKSWQELYAADEVVRFQSQVLPLLLGRGAWKGETLGKKRDGSFFPQEVSLTMTDDRGTICVVRDISERKEAERQLQDLNQHLQQRATELQKANHDLESFSYTLSHDARNILCQISLASQELNDQYFGALDETGNYLLKTLGESCLRMDELFEAILLLSKVSQCEISREEIDLSEMANAVGYGFLVRHPERTVNFFVQPGLRVTGDRALLQVLLANLLGNAWKYSNLQSKARIEFGAQRQNGAEVFFVSDNGVGFDMQEAGKLFRPFSRLSAARGYHGSGVGLATVERIVRAHGGAIWAEAAPGAGATFFFRLK